MFSHYVLQTLYLGPDRVDRSSELIHDILDIEPEDSSSSSEEIKDDDDDDSSWWSFTWRRSRQTERRTERRSSPSSLPFDPVPTHSSISRPSKRKIISVLKTHGSSRGSEKKVQLQLTYIHDEELKKHQDDLQIIYGPSDSPSEEKKVRLYVNILIRH